jgi:hypothetical protein
VRSKYTHRAAEAAMSRMAFSRSCSHVNVPTLAVEMEVMATVSPGSAPVIREAICAVMDDPGVEFAGPMNFARWISTHLSGR